MYQTPAPADRASASARAEGLASLQQAGLAAINNCLLIDISVPVGFFTGRFCTISGYEKKQEYVTARQDQFSRFPSRSVFEAGMSLEFTPAVTLGWHHRQNTRQILTNTGLRSLHFAVEEAEAQRGQVVCLRSHRQEVGEWGFEPRTVCSPATTLPSPSLQDWLALKLTLSSLCRALW